MTFVERNFAAWLTTSLFDTALKHRDSFIIVMGQGRIRAKWSKIFRLKSVKIRQKCEKLNEKSLTQKVLIQYFDFCLNGDIAFFIPEMIFSPKIK